MKTYIQITGGRGPVECARTVTLVAKELQEEYPDLELVDYEAHNTEPGCFMSMTLSTNSENVSQMKAEWEGTVQWIATKNPFRPNHKRKNWFVGVHFFSKADEGIEHEANILNTIDILNEQNMDNDIYKDFTIDEIYNGRDGGAYRASRYLSKAITSEGKERLYSSFSLNEGIDFEPSLNEKGGIITFSTDVNAEKQSGNKIVNWLKQKMMTIPNRIDATGKIDTIATGNELVGWTIGHYLDGRYTAKNGKEYGEKSLSVEIIGVDFETLMKIAMELCASFRQESVLLKDFSSGRVLCVLKKGN